jgi:hypothetical protein
MTVLEPRRDASESRPWLSRSLGLAEAYRSHGKAWFKAETTHTQVLRLGSPSQIKTQVCPRVHL